MPPPSLIYINPSDVEQAPQPRGTRSVDLCLGVTKGLRERESPSVTSPALNSAPTPDGRAAELAKRLRETRVRRNHVDALRRDAESFRDVDGDDKFGMRIQLHDLVTVARLLIHINGSDSCSRSLSGLKGASAVPVTTTQLAERHV